MTVDFDATLVSGSVSTTALADLVGHAQVMASGIRPLWSGMPRIAGPAFTVRCPAGDHLMVHAAIYRAPAGSILVAESGDASYALAGGNVCAIAQRRGINGFVIDGSIRDIAEVRERKFPVFARGTVPFPGGKNHVDTLNDKPVTCGGVVVHPGDYVVADEDGVVVIPRANALDVVRRAAERVAKESAQSLDEWEAAHCEKVASLLRTKGATFDVTPGGSRPSGGSTRRS